MSAEKPKRYHTSEMMLTPDPAGCFIDASDFDAREVLWRELVECIDNSPQLPVREPAYIRGIELRRLLGIEEGE